MFNSPLLDGFDQIMLLGIMFYIGLNRESIKIVSETTRHDKALILCL